jgi:hypothetical protein
MSYTARARSGLWGFDKQSKSFKLIKQKFFFLRNLNVAQLQVSKVESKTKPQKIIIMVFIETKEITIQLLVNPKRTFKNVN